MPIVEKARNEIPFGDGGDGDVMLHDGDGGDDGGIDDDGGPAFPLNGDIIHERQTGMTQLDWFAGQIVKGVAVAVDVDRQARDAYRLAAAMVRRGTPRRPATDSPESAMRVDRQDDDIPF